MSMGSLPYVFLLDLDGTVWGDVKFQSTAHSLTTTLRKLGYRPKKHYVIPPAYTPKSKLIRPGLVPFMKGLQTFLGNNVQFFIYTASERTWALQEIAWLEKSFGIQFARPIFNRDDCTVDASGQYRKSVGHIFPRICRALNRVRAQPLSKEERLHILEHQLICIDNNAVYTDRADKLLLCPDYNYTLFENLLDYIPPEALVDSRVQRVIYSLINNGMICPMPQKGDDDHVRQLALSYGWLAAKCKAVSDVNKTYLHDDFWSYLRKLIVQNDLRRFPQNIIRQLQEAVWKHFKNKVQKPKN
jgi:hypothetical protein